VQWFWFVRFSLLDCHCITHCSYTSFVHCIKEFFSKSKHRSLWKDEFFLDSFHRQCCIANVCRAGPCVGLYRLSNGLLVSVFSGSFSVTIMTVRLLLLSLVTWPCRGIHAEDNFHFTPHCKSQSMDNCCTSPMILLVNCLCYKSFLNCILHGDCQQHSYMSSSYRSNRLGLSHWDPYAVHKRWLPRVVLL